MVSAGVALTNTLFAKLLPLAIVIPLFLRIQSYDFLDFINFPQFSIEQGAYVLAIGVIIAAAIMEFRISQGGVRTFESLNLGSGLALVIVAVGLILLGFIIATNETNFSGASGLNDIISFYLGFSILIIGIQAIREVTGTRKEISRQRG